jgi:hypothetical protein
MKTYVTCIMIFLWTWTLTQLPIGYLAYVSEGSILNWMMRLCALFIMILNLLSRYIGVTSLYMIFAVIGFNQAVIPVCIHSLLAAWAPPSERARMGEKI